MTPFLFLALAAFALLAWRDHRKAFLLFSALLPTYLVRFTVLGVPTTALEALFLILFAAWMLKRQKRLVDIRGWRLFLLAWVAVATVAVFVSPLTREAAGVWKAYYVEPVLFFIIACDILRTEADRSAALRSLAWCAIAVGATAVIQAFTRWGVPPPWNLPGQFRATSFYGFPNGVGLFLAPLIPLFADQALASSLKTYGRTQIGNGAFWLFGAAFAAAVVAIALAQSEGAAVGATVGLIFLGLMHPRVRKPLTIGLISIIVIAGLIAPVRTRLVQNLTLGGWSGRVRTQMWGEALHMLKDHAVFGAGLSGYPIVFKPYHKATWIEIFQYPHDIFLNFWSELGIAGPILLIIFIGLLIRTSIAAWRAGDAGTRRWILGLAAAFIAILVHGLVDVPYFKNDLAMEWWLLLALIVSIRAEQNARS